MDFKLSAQLLGHESDVRAVAFPSSDVVISASRDQTVRAWRKSSEKPSSYEATITTKGQEFINTVAYLPPTAEYPDGLIISGGKDTLIEVKTPQSSPTDNAERLLIGHASNICALDVSPKGTWIVSGSWDSKAIVWQVGKWTPELVLGGHDGSVWGVLALDEQTVVTGSADTKIHIYNLSSATSGSEVQPRSTIFTIDVVRAVCRVPTGHSSGADFASSHNDGVIRLWKLDGQSAGELHGHDSYVYSLAALPSGELVSAGEDRTIRIWKGTECIQTVTLPAISVWAVAVCQQTGDIVSGSSDAVVRIFTRNEENIASPDAIQQFEESVKASSIPQQQMPSINKENLPGPDFLTTKSGTKEGQVQMIRQKDGSITAHTWSTSQQQWINVGTVVDAVGSSGKKVEYLGGTYDFVFDVDIEDGKPPLKLPYNLSQNPYEAATKFLGDNELPLSYLDSVSNFITENTKGHTIGAQSSQSTVDEFGTGRYQPGDGSDSQPTPAKKTLPLENYLTLATANLEPVVKKIMSVNATMISAGRKDFAMNPTETDILEDLIEKLKLAIPTIPTQIPATSQIPSRPKLAISEQAVSLVLKLVTQWPEADRLPGLDLLRCMVTIPMDIARFDELHSSSALIDGALVAVFNVSDKINENRAMMAFRVVVNMFGTIAGRRAAYQKIDKVIECMETALSQTTSPKVHMALTTAAVNYAILARLPFIGEKNAATVAPEHLARLGAVLVKILGAVPDAEVTYRALAALGTIAAGDANCGPALVKVGVIDAIKAVVQKGPETRVVKLANESLALLSSKTS